jgi:hypothetical protein
MAKVKQQVEQDKYIVLTAGNANELRYEINTKAAAGYVVIGSVAVSTYWKSYELYHEYVVTMMKSE